MSAADGAHLTGLNQALDDGDELLLDVRHLDEIQAEGYIPSSLQLQIPIDELTDRRGEFPQDKATRIVTYCGSGYRCLLAMMMLRAYGYTDVRNLRRRASSMAGRRVPPCRAALTLKHPQRVATGC